MLPITILFLGVLAAVLVGVHVLLASMARSAVQNAAEQALEAAQTAGPGLDECDGDTNTQETARECNGILAARLAIAAASSSVAETRIPVVIVESERSSVTAIVFGGVISPVLGGMELTAQACGPLDNVPASELVGTDVWQC